MVLYRDVIISWFCLILGNVQFSAPFPGAINLRISQMFVEVALHFQFNNGLLTSPPIIILCFQFLTAVSFLCRIANGKSSCANSVILNYYFLCTGVPFDLRNFLLQGWRGTE